MKNPSRLVSKKTSKTEAVQGCRRQAPGRREHPRRPERLCSLAEGQQDLLHPHGRTIVGDGSHGCGIETVGGRFANSAGVAIDMIRCCKLSAVERLGRTARGAERVFLQASSEAATRTTLPTTWLRPSYATTPQTESSCPLICLIVAAGTGGRLRERGQSKPLVPVNGERLLGARHHACPKRRRRALPGGERLPGGRCARSARRVFPTGKEFQSGTCITTSGNAATASPSRRRDLFWTVRFC